VAWSVVSDARTEILRRVRGALADVPDAERPADVAVARDYRHRDAASPGRHVDRFEQRVSDYHATVRRVGADVSGAVTQACRGLGLRRIGVPIDLPPSWRPDGVEIVSDSGLSAGELDQLDGALTGCAAAIADTGTIVLDGQGVSGRRALSLIPDHYVCVVLAEQIVGLVPEALARVSDAVVARRLPITLVSGPSATSDIELSRVEGVHGPRHLLVLIAEGTDA
jgi:L-lactate dehydrogenase complex protein LldG